MTRYVKWIISRGDGKIGFRATVFESPARTGESVPDPGYQGSLFIRGAICGPKRATLAISDINPAMPRHRAATAT